MFAVAVVIWGFVLILFIRNSRRKKKGSFAKHRSTFIAVLAALVLTVADSWVFIEYIPTHFKKHPVTAVSLPATDLLNDSSLNDSLPKPPVETKRKDSAKQDKVAVTDLNGKIHLTHTASIRFLSHGSSENIEASNHSVACSFNEKTGQLRLSGLIKGFQFENEMMQEHFNDKDYMNSEAFPKTNFSGNIQNLQAGNFTKDGKYPVTAAGRLTIHGVTKNITAPGIIIVAGNKLTLQSTFTIKRADFGINTDEIAEELEITVIAGF